jgi:DNA-binding MarR family transcriptional regulator
MRALGLQEHKLDLDHFLLLEAFATGSCCSEADLVRTLGRNASFYSRAVDRMVGQGWLKRRPKPRRDMKFEVKITAKGRQVYNEIQARLAEQLLEKLGRSSVAVQDLRAMVKKGGLQRASE